MHIFGNRMVVVHLSLTKNTCTRSANAFENEGTEGFLTREGRQSFQHGLFYYYFKKYNFLIEFAEK